MGVSCLSAISRNKMIVRLPDSEVKIDATLAPRCQSHVPFLKSGCVVKILSTHGGPDDLTVVSYVDL